MAALLHQLEAVDPFTPPASTSQSPAFMHHCDLLRLLTSGVLSWLSHSYSWVRRPPPAKDPLMVSTRLHLMWPELARGSSVVLLWSHKAQFHGRELE